MKISIENCTDSVTLLELVKFVRNAISKDSVIKCEYGNIDWKEKIESQNIKDNEFEGMLPWGESILH